MIIHEQLGAFLKPPDDIDTLYGTVTIVFFQNFFS
jgi:hypothetical protein